MEDVTLEHLGLRGGPEVLFYMEWSRMTSLRSQHLSDNSKIGNKSCGYLGEECSSRGQKL